MSENRQERPPVGGGPQMGRPGEKPKNFKDSARKLMAYSRSYIASVLISLSFAAIASVFLIVGPNQLSEMTDLIIKGMMTEIDLDAVADIGIFLTTLYAIGFVFNYVQGFMMATIAQRISHQLRQDITHKINRLPLNYFDKTSYGDVLSRVTNDVDSIGQTLNQSLATLVSAATLFIGSFIMMLYTNWIMALAALGATIVGFGLMMFMMKKSQTYFVQQQRQLGKLNGHIEEIYTGHSVVKAYNAERLAKQAFDEMNTTLYDSVWRSQFLSGLMFPLMGFVGNFGYVIVCLVGAALAINGDISFGVIVAFMVYIRLFTQPLTQLAQAMTNLQSTVAASERVFEFLGEEELSDERGKTATLTDVKGAVSFRDVSFGYTPEKTIINRFTTEIGAGQKVAIVGPTGAGKTTIVNLLMRFYEVNSGDILIDGVSIRDLTREQVHRLFGMVLQDTWLFEGTIKENIVYSKVGVTDEQVEAACKAVGIDHFIHTLPHGYETILNDKANLSAGQKQLITIARAMIDNAPLLILDEATSSVDTRTELLIQQSMERLTVGRTAFIIAHRLSTIKNADLILVMKDGDIIEKGTHDELVQDGGFYADLYQSQFENVS